MAKEVTGLNAILKKWNRTNRSISKRVALGLKAGGLFLQTESQHLAPVMSGDMKASAYTKNVGGQGFNADIVVGYLSGYAGAVHEDLSAAHGKAFNTKHAAKIAWIQANSTTSQQKIWDFKSPEEQAKFLQKPVNEQRRAILRIIARNTFV